MAILVSCRCGKTYRAVDEDAGRRARCPDCCSTLVIPRAKPRLNGDSPTVDSERDLRHQEFFESPTSGRANASLALGVSSLLLAFFAGIPAIILGWLSLRDIKQSRGRIKGRGIALAGILIGAFGSTAITLVGLVPMVAAWRDQARKDQCVENLKTITKALHEFHATYNTFPPQAITNKQGIPLLSWRVAILPQMGPEGLELFNKFRLDEPWDGPHNLPLQKLMPQVYACPSDSSLGLGLTNYQVIVGPRTIFTGGRRGVSVKSVSDGTSNTLMLTEAAQPVSWTSPQDLPFDPNVTLFGCGSCHSRGFHIAYGDGSVQFVHSTVPGGVLGPIITRDGGENVTLP